MNEELVAALERLYAITQKKRRKRGTKEAPVALTNAYAALLFAWGFASMRSRDRARELLDAGLQTLRQPPYDTDPVHAYLAVAFTARIETAMAGRPRTTGIPAKVLELYTQLTHAETYKVNRLREASVILTPTDQVDAISTLSRRQQHPGDTVELASTTEERRDRIVELVEQAASSDRATGIELLLRCLDEMCDLPEAIGMPLLVDITEAIEALPEAPAILYAEALSVAAWFGWGELVARLAAPVIPRVVTLETDGLIAVFDRVARSLRRLDLVDELRELVASVEPRARENSTPEALRARPLAFVMTVQHTGAFAYVNPASGEPQLALAFERIEKGMTLTTRLNTTRTLAKASSLATIPAAIASIERLAKQFHGITDSFGTNSHFCLAVLHFIDSLVVGLAEARLGRDSRG